MGSPLATDAMRRAYAPRPRRLGWRDRCWIVAVLVAGVAVDAAIVGLVMLVW